MDRRLGVRCPVCQGPATADADATDGVRCRRSICPHNHARVECPRCGERDLDGVSFEGGTYEYTCKECTNKWRV